MIQSNKLLLLIVVILSTLVSISYSQKVDIHDIVNPKRYDNDEFEGFETLKQPQQEESQQKEDQQEIDESTSSIDKDSSSEKTEKESPKGPKNFIMEIGFITLLVIYGINYFFGVRENRNIVKLWGKKFQGLFEDNFAKIGNKDKFTILKIDSNTYSFIATGRNNCFGVQITLDLKKRQDFLYVLLDLVGYAEPDKMTIEIAMPANMEPMVFAIIRSKVLKKFKADHADVELYCSKSNSPTNLSNNYTVLCDTDCLPSLFLNSEVVQCLNNSQSLFESILFSDNSTISPKYPKIIQGIFKFKVSELDKLFTLGSMMIHFIDLVANVSLPKPYKQQAEKLRLKAKEQEVKQKHTERQEEAQRKKYEKIQKEKEAASKLTPEQQRKYDEKEYKKQLKKRSKGFSKVVVG